LGRRRLVEAQKEETEGQAVKFFMPGTESPEAAERIYQRAREIYKAVETDTRIRSIKFWDDELHKDIELTVGKPDYLDRQDVKMILDCGVCYYAFTERRGGRDWPIMVNKHEVSHVEKFDPPEPSAPK
jgi:hypothetical protein